MVPYAALRFTPPMPAEEKDKPAARRGGPPGLMGMMMPRFNRNRGGRQTPLQVGAPGRVNRERRHLTFLDLPDIRLINIDNQFHRR